MSSSYDSPYTDGDFMDIWQPDSTDAMNLNSHEPTGRSLPASFSEQVFAEAQSEMNPEMLDFLTATDPFNSAAANPHEYGFDIDLSLDWRVPNPSSNQFSNTGTPDDTVFRSQNSNQLVPLGQQLPVHNFPHSYFDQYLEQGLQNCSLPSYPSPEFGQYPEQDLQSCPLPSYSSPDFDQGTNSPPYGRQVLQQPGQLLHSNTQDLYNNNNNNFGFSPDAQFASNYNTHESPASTIRKSRSSPGNQKVSLNRAAKQRGDPSCDPSLCYASDPSKISPWGSMTWNGQHLFSYTPKGQWLRDRCFTKQQFREYADNCGKDTVFWVQQAPTQCNHRLEPEDRICRWANCPVANRTITAGWLRVAFDEFPHLTSCGARDPLKCAGSVHLWCFEQIFDPLELHLSGRLRPEDRQFPFEDKSVVTLEKLTDAGIIREAYRPWFEQRMFSLNQQPREYYDSLSYRLTKYHIENQTAARQKARSKRNDTKSEGERRTIDVHLGNLKLFVEITNRVRRSKKIRKLRKVQAEDADDSNDSSSQSLALTCTRPTRNRTQRAMTDRYPESTGVNSLSHELRRSRGSYLSDTNMQEVSGRGMAPVYGRHMQSDPAKFPSVGSQNRNLNTYQFIPTLNSNMRSRLPSYSDPLNPAHNSLQSTIRPSITTASTFPHYLQDSHLGISNQNYSQNVMGPRFNRATRGQPRPVLRPIITQPLPQYPFSVKPSTRRDAFTQTTGETLPLLGGRNNAGFFDSHRRRSPTHEELDFDLPIDPRISEDKLKASRHQKEDVIEANDAFTVHTLTDPVAFQPPGIMDCAVSPRVTATSLHWDSLVDFGGFSGAGLSPLLKDFTATNGVDGERAATLTGVSVQHVSTPEVARLKRKNLSPSETTQSGQESKRRRTDTSQL